MIRPLIPLDFVRCVFLGDSLKFNRAYTLRAMLAPRPSTRSVLGVSMAGLGVRNASRAWVWHEGNRVHAMISIAERSGSESWEVTHLFCGDGGERRIGTLLERAAFAAGSQGGHKVFIRLKRDDPLVDVARQSGYFPRIPETLYVREQQPVRGGNSFEGRVSRSIEMRPRKGSDELGLFRLYNAATPPEARQALGMTIDQWAASQERSIGRTKETLLVRESETRGWVRTSRRGNTAELAAMILPKQEVSLADITDKALDDLRDVRRIYSLLPEYQIALRRVLSERRFSPTGDYVTLVKSMTLTESEKSVVRAPAPSA